MTSVDLIKQQLVEFREESGAAAGKHRTHIKHETSATIQDGHDLLRKLKLAERDEQRAVKRESLQDTPLTSRLQPQGGPMERAAVENYRDIARKRKAKNGYDATAIALGSTGALHSTTGASLAQYRMSQQHQQMMMSASYAAAVHGKFTMDGRKPNAPVCDAHADTEFEILLVYDIAFTVRHEKRHLKWVRKR